MASARRLDVDDEEIAQLLYNSDIDEIEETGTFDTVEASANSPLENNEEFSDSGSSSVRRSDLESSDTNSEFEVPEELNGRDEDTISTPTLPARGRGRTTRRGERTRGGSSRINLQNPSTSSSNLNCDGWSIKNFNPQVISRVEPSYLPIDEDLLTEKIDYFKLYIDDELIELIALKTNQTYLARHGNCLGLSINELYIYFAITMAMSCIQYPQLRMYWQHDYRVSLIADNMARNRFFVLRNSIMLVVDDDVSSREKERDRLWRVRPLISRIQGACRKIEKNTLICIDEMIIPFCGNCGIKQYCPGKPNPTGLKAFVLANPDGTICVFCLNQGETTYPEYANTIYNLPEKALLNLTESLVAGHIVYFDRYFNGLRLAEELLSRGIMCAGTLMKNRIPKPLRPLLLEDRCMKRMRRGTMQVIVRDGDDIAVTKWFDSKGITFLSTVHADQTIDTCQRWSKKNRQYETVNRPEVVKCYNINMGGVDLADRLLSVCPFRYRTKKWTQRFTTHMFDLAVSNSWLMFKKKELSRGVPKKKFSN